jgi:cytochrome c oxidase subunit 2
MEKTEVMLRKCLWFPIVAVLVVISGLPALAHAQPGPRRIEITASQFAFAPAEITLKKGQPVVLVLNSKDVAHGLRVREFNVAVKVNASGTAEAKFTPQKTGDFVGHCYVFCGKGHGSMVLNFRVVD